jgi:hypothetical protein
VANIMAKVPVGEKQDLFFFSKSPPDSFGRV